MNRDLIAARNLANARRSTGPRSPEGKARSAQNARRHGATAAPPREVVGTWLGIVLGRPWLDPDHLDPGDPRMKRALDLAVAEARHVQADAALQAFEAGLAEPSEDLVRLVSDLELFEDIVQTLPPWHEVAKFAMSLIRQRQPKIEMETCPGRRRHRILKRYAREARARRKAAFRAWIEIERVGGEAVARNSRNEASLQPEVVSREGRRFL